MHWFSSLWEPCLNRCDPDWAGNGSAVDEERRVLSVPLQTPVCIWGPGLSSTYSCFFCSFIRGPHHWLPRLGTSWWLYCNESGKQVLVENSRSWLETTAIFFLNVFVETLVWKPGAFPSSFRMSRIQLLCQISLKLSTQCAALGTAASTNAVTTMPRITTKR